MSFAGIPGWAVGLLIAGSAAVLAVLHLLHVRPRRVRVVTTLFWQQALSEARPRMLTGRLRNLPTYLLLLLICTLIALALGRPMWTPDGQVVHVVIVADAGMSMAGVDENGVPRIRRLRETVRACMNDRASGARVAVIVADPWPRLLHAFSDSLSLLPHKLESIVPARAPAARTEAIGLAKSLTSDKIAGRIVVVTDRELEDAPWPSSASTDDEAVRVVSIGAPGDNAAIVSAVFVPDSDNPLIGTFSARIAMEAAVPRNVTVRILHSDGGQELLSTSLQLAPGMTSDVNLPAMPADGAPLTVVIDTDDAILSDNVMSFRLPRRSPVRIGGADSLPTGIRAGLEKGGACRTVAENQPCDVRVLTAGQTLAADRAETGGWIVIDASGLPASNGELIRVGQAEALVHGIDLAYAVAGSAGSLSSTGSTASAPASGPALSPLLTAGDRTLAAWRTEGEHQQLWLSPALWSQGGNAAQRPGFAVMLERALRRMAGWSGDPIVLSAERKVRDPLWAASVGERDDVYVAPSGRETFDSAPLEATVVSSGRWQGRSLFEWLALGAFVLLLVEGFLHARGRIV